MGEEKVRFTPTHNRIRCRKCGNEYTQTAVRRCPHTAVKEAFGEDDFICLYCCKRKPCKFYYRVEYTGLAGCSYNYKEVDDV
jgi:hypothetical protein